MKKLTGAIVFILLVGCSANNTDTEDQTGAPPSNSQVQQVIAKELDVPWDINKHENTFFISQRGGSIVEVGEAGEKEEQELSLSKDVVEKGEGGLLGFLLHPSFSETQEAFLYHTYEQEGKLLNRVITIKLEEGVWKEQSVLLDQIPGDSIHNGGRLEMGPDQKLYVSVGDAAKQSSAQDKNTLSGSILRMNMDGTVPSDNPFDQSYVYSYGHRNPQGMAWDEDGTMYAAEHGSSAHDEINIIKPGHNYGWPVIQGDEEQEGMETPLFHSGDETWAPSALAYNQGRLFAAGLRGEQLRMFDLEEKASSVYVQDVGRVRDILIAEASMYIVTNNTDGRGTPGPEDDKLIQITTE
ncbi:PQQ-dependent sugar dehydrogenase [Pontibacillus salicampi]|uniref:PQQ-dependent sugar dehydrogenase n=1 Tax=Pontibacillus salicampi TaxID=1449801 RepID=A0ABV6LME4_9BACI